ncbi:hemolysin family protein [Desulfurivibrio alkaliphilus]|uniref:CBS domain containing protein n=1 Tax=Desulfurivibrio alkaliphilus (strain DSM 19089 / UNIQEM U267 / AHT2) TaxID=589865 RepID=D6Z008_DESAT|nr:hemolysin family protein [Desulfurivibrio alkaliphilus]ADH85165.1 CBS domain containing protein [Desulfurivibrio alkaliphilus AHT 2]
MDPSPEPAPAEPPTSPRAAESPFRRLLNLLGISKNPDTAEEIEKEIQEILDEGEEQGLITPEEGEMIAGIMELKDTQAYEVMTPRAEMVMAEAATPLADLLQLIIDRGFSRIPVYRDSPDQIIGILHAKDLLPYCLNGSEPPTAGMLAKPAVFVQEKSKVIKLLKSFQQQKNHMAVVNDEFGGVRGLITLEDIVEEIVGDIVDEHDRTTRRWKVVDPNTVLADAKVDIEEVEDFFGTELPEGPYESLGGLILHHLDQVPPPGVTLSIESLVFEVIAADKRRVLTVKIQKKIT